MAEPGGTGISRILVSGKNGVNTTVFKFTRSFEVNTINYANTFLPSGTLPAAHRLRTDGHHLLTPLAVLNPNNLQLYMNAIEFDELPTTSYAAKCRIRVTPLSYRTSFETASTNVGAANSQMPVNIMYAVGLNKIFPHGMAPYVGGLSDMKPTNTSSLSEADDNGLWTPFLNGIRSLQSPAMRSYAYFPNSSNTLLSSDLSKHVTKENLITAKGHTVIDYEYNFKVSPLKNIRNPVGMYTSLYQKLPLAQQHRPAYYNTGTAEPESGGYSATNTARSFGYTNGIEKAQFMMMEAENSHTSDSVPFIYFGGQAVLSSVPGASSPTFSNVYTQWHIETELEVHSNINFADVELRLLPHFNPLLARILFSKMDTMHPWDSAGHQQVHISGRFYNSNSTAAVLLTGAEKKAEKTNDIKRTRRNVTPDLSCEETMPEEDPVVTKQVDRRPYRRALFENEGVMDLFQ